MRSYSLEDLKKDLFPEIHNDDVGKSYFFEMKIPVNGLHACYMHNELTGYRHNELTGYFTGYMHNELNSLKIKNDLKNYFLKKFSNAFF